MVQFSKFVLTNTNVPKLQYLHLTNLQDVSPDVCEFNVSASNLKHLEIYFMTCEDITVINKMLTAATCLQVFKSRKLQVFGDQNLIFNSNNIKEIVLTRSDCLRGITLWAPRLKMLNLNACYDLEIIDILDDHALRSKLPDDIKFSKFTVDLTNVCRSDALLAYLNSNRRVREIIGVREDGDY